MAKGEPKEVEIHNIGMGLEEAQYQIIFRSRIVATLCRDWEVVTGYRMPPRTKAKIKIVVETIVEAEKLDS